jgi:DNA-binding transcriptional ArsR family regulator
MYQSKVFARRRRAPLAAVTAAVDLPSARELQPCAADAAALLKALAHPTRLLLACHLAEREHTVGELGLRAGVDQPNLSQQLGVLRDGGLVATRREGKHVHYQIASPNVLALLRTLHAVYVTARPGAG